MASAQMNVGSGIEGMLKEGYKEMSGLEMAILKNIEACKNLGKVTRTSMGPNGMNKLLINHLNKIFVTSNAGTMLGELEVVHPAAKMLVMAAKTQEEEYGDYTNFVLTFAGELLAQAEPLLQQGVHPSDIISGYKKASDLATDKFDTLVCQVLSKKDLFNQTLLSQSIYSVICAKQVGFADILSSLVAQSCLIVLGDEKEGKRPNLVMDSVRIAKLIGGSVSDSKVVKGMVIRRPPESTVRKVDNAKVAVFGTSVEAAQTETKGTVKITSAEELLNYTKSEERLLEDQIKGIKDSGVDVVISGGSISEMALHYIDKYELLAVKIASKFELKRLCQTCGATPLVRVGPVLPDEQGTVDKVYTTELAGGKVTIFEQNSDGEGSKVSTIVFRSATTNQLDDLERAATDGINAVKSLCEDGRLLPGGGACEIGLACLVSELGERTQGLEQYAIKKFATALEIVPRILAENSGQDPTVIISELYSARKRGNTTIGFNVEKGCVSDMKKDNLFDIFAAKYQALRLATDVVLTILSIDQLIMSKQAGGPKVPQQGGAPSGGEGGMDD